MTSPLSTGAASKAASRFVDFVNEAVTPFHAVQRIVTALAGAGYTPLREGAEWPVINPGAKHYVVRNDSSIVAFAVGGKFAPGCGLKIVGAHTDSPNLSLKPRTQSTKHGFDSVNVQPYGGGLWHTWFDRDLTVAGRLLVKDENNEVSKRFVNVKRPILRIPNLAIHLLTGSEREAGFAPNKENHLVPVLSTAVAEALFAPAASGTSAESEKKQSKGLFRLLGEHGKVDASNIIDFDLSVIDTQPASIGGLHDEFVFAPRIDNLLSCFSGLEALLSADGTLEHDTTVRMIAFFDHEEVGSESTHGAGGSLIPDLIERIQGSHRAQAVANSFLLSVDCAHGCHPNYSERHEATHRPLVQGGPVIKYNPNQRYATNGETAAWLMLLAQSADVPVQQFCVKNDSPCGTTIGPILSALSGIRAVDIGAPMLSMHSIREMCGSADIHYMTELLKAFFDRPLPRTAE